MAKCAFIACEYTGKHLCSMEIPGYAFTVSLCDTHERATRAGVPMSVEAHRLPGSDSPALAPASDLGVH